MYRVHNIMIRAKDRSKADVIINAHRDDIDDIRVCDHTNSGCRCTVVYWIKPYVYENFETIKNEFKQNGIQIL